jgi:SAM-dependent methyltransferase
VTGRPGSFPDDLDQFQWMESFEDPEKWEAAIKGAFEEARNDPELDRLLKTHYLEEDLAASFATYRESGVPGMVDTLLQRLGVSRQTPIADVGCGRGHAAHAMFKLGYENVTAMDPNSEWFTGTGYLRSLTDHRIRIVNDLDEWKASGGHFGALISSGTVHHWRHIPQTAIVTRRTLKPGGYWLMMAEYFANSAREFVDGLNSHPTSTRFGSYEWAYPASVYADLMQASGFMLVGVIPLYYRGALFYSGCSLPLDVELDPWVDENLIASDGTVEAFWSEIDAWRRGTATRRNYTVPQVLIFQRVEV